MSRLTVTSRKINISNDECKAYNIGDIVYVVTDSIDIFLIGRGEVVAIDARDEHSIKGDCIYTVRLDEGPDITATSYRVFNDKKKLKEAACESVKQWRKDINKSIKEYFKTY